MLKVEAGTENSYPAMLTVAQAARFLRTSRVQISQLCADGVIPSVKIGNAVRIPKRQLVDWLMQKKG